MEIADESGAGAPRSVWRCPSRYAAASGAGTPVATSAMSRRSRSLRESVRQPWPGRRRTQLIPQGHAGHVDQVRVLGGRRLAQVEQGTDVGGVGVEAQRLGRRAADERVAVLQAAQGEFAKRPVQLGSLAQDRAWRGRAPRARRRGAAASRVASSSSPRRSRTQRACTLRAGREFAASSRSSVAVNARSPSGPACRPADWRPGSGRPGWDGRGS